MNSTRLKCTRLNSTQRTPLPLKFWTDSTETSIGQRIRLDSISVDSALDNCRSQIITQECRSALPIRPDFEPYLNQTG